MALYVVSRMLLGEEKLKLHNFPHLCRQMANDCASILSPQQVATQAVMPAPCPYPNLIEPSAPTCNLSFFVGFGVGSAFAGVAFLGAADRLGAAFTGLFVRGVRLGATFP